VTRPARIALILGLFAAAAALAWSARPQLARIDAAGAGEPALTVATFSSAFCSACRILKPRLAEIIDDFADAPVRFIEYDFTLSKPEGLAARADSDGLASAFVRFAPATGFALLVERETGEIIGMLTINHSRDEMRDAIDNALALALKRRHSSAVVSPFSSR
jgi:thiol-disulfide isomerase/thioredoxin